MNIEFAILDWIQEHLSCPLMDWLMVSFPALVIAGSSDHYHYYPINT